jgi:hypothetical protein
MVGGVALAGATLAGALAHIDSKKMGTVNGPFGAIFAINGPFGVIPAILAQPEVGGRPGTGGSTIQDGNHRQIALNRRCRP